MKGWTILFFIYVEDDESVEYSNNLFKSLTRVTNGENFSLLLYETRFNAAAQNTISGQLFEFIAAGPNTHRRKKLVHDFGIVNPGNTNVLGQALKYLQAENLIREKFMLFTWAHGSGFGIFDNDPTPVDEKFNEFIRGPIGTHEILSDIEGNDQSATGFRVITNRRTRAIEGLPMEAEHFRMNQKHVGSNNFLLNNEVDPRIDMLTANEINRGLETLERKTNIVIMMNCWVGMLENGYELANTVNILIAPESVFFYAGYDYETILNAMAVDHTIGEKEVAKLTISTIPSNFNAVPKWRKHLREINVAAVYPAKAGILVNSLNQICIEVNENINTNINQIQSVRKGVIDFTTGYIKQTVNHVEIIHEDFFIDCIDFLNRLTAINLISANSFEKLLQAAQGYVSYSFRGDWFVGPDTLTQKPLAHGFSIYHPPTKSDFSKWLYYSFFYRDQATKVKLADSGWGDYLVEYKKKSH